MIPLDTLWNSREDRAPLYALLDPIGLQGVLFPIQAFLIKSTCHAYRTGSTLLC
jgi:hypothetical protein